MSLEKTTGKRVGLPRQSSYAKAFAKDFDRYTRAGRSDMARVKELMLLLIANNAPLDAKWRDHALAGEWTGVRDAHVHGDLLLLYRLLDKENAVVFERLGTHSELF